MKRIKSIFSLAMSILMILSLVQGIGTVAFASEQSSISSVTVYGNFETAGIDLKVNNMNFNESATIEYKEKSVSEYRQGHYFVRYDGNHMATSLFNLKNNTIYDIKITLNDPDGVAGNNVVYKTLTTKPEFKIPNPSRVIFVSNQSQLDKAAAKLKPGYEIRLAANTYKDGINLSNVKGTAAHPIVFSSQSKQKPLITGCANITLSSYIVLNNLEVHNEAGGVSIKASDHIVVNECYIHDSDGVSGNGKNIRISSSISGYSNNLIINNIIGDDMHGAVTDKQGPGGSNTSASEQCYYGIDLINNPGGYNTIRGNEIYGVTDGVHTGSDEGQEPLMGPDEPDLLNTWKDQNLDFYDNIIYDCKDDCIETDGHMVNGRWFRNRLGRCQNSISVAPLYPGPLFFIWNYANGFNEGSVKTNTSVPGVTRNAFFYQNTFVESSKSAYCFIKGNGKVQNFTYRNNIFYARGIIYTGFSGQPEDDYIKDSTFDYDLMFTNREKFSNPDPDTNIIFKWRTWSGDPLNGTEYTDFASFQQATQQELHGKYGDPKLDLTTLTKYPDISRLASLEISSDSAAIDSGVLLPGINDDYAGAAPDAGAYEYGKTIVPTPTPAPYPVPESDMKLNVSGKIVTLTKTPISVAGTILLQSDVLSKALRASSKYDSKKHMITITKGKIKIVMTINSKKVKIGSKSYTLDAAPKYNSKVAFVSAKFVAEKLGYKYSFNYSNGLITIKK